MLCVTSDITGLPGRPGTGGGLVKAGSLISLSWLTPASLSARTLKQYEAFGVSPLTFATP